MVTESLFHQLPGSASQAGNTIAIEFNGERLQVHPGISLGAALLAAGVKTFRSTPVTGAPRAPYCMMGVCFECLVEVDGVPNMQSCLIPVRAGMAVRAMEGARVLNAGQEASND